MASRPDDSAAHENLSPRDFTSAFMDRSAGFPLPDLRRRRSSGRQSSKVLDGDNSGGGASVELEVSEKNFRGQVCDEDFLLGGHRSFTRDRVSHAEDAQDDERPVDLLSASVNEVAAHATDAQSGPFGKADSPPPINYESKRSSLSKGQESRRRVSLASDEYLSSARQDVDGSPALQTKDQSNCPGPSESDDVGIRRRSYQLFLDSRPTPDRVDSANTKPRTRPAALTFPHNVPIGHHLSPNMDLSSVFFVTSILPNVRDIALSSEVIGMKQNMLYRSARNFALNADVLHGVMVTALGINTVIDLREDDLSRAPADEQHSRSLMRQLYRLQVPVYRGKGAMRMPNTVDDARIYLMNEHHAGRSSQTMAPRPSTSDPDLLRRQGHRGSASVSADTDLTGGRPTQGDAATWNQNLPSGESEGPPVVSGRGSGSQRKRKLYICNFMATDQCKARIMNVVKESGKMTLSFMALLRVTDKIIGSAYAPYYFCKYFVAMEDVAKSYVEMLEHCGEKIAEALRLITVAEGPILFHCSLGKDRTGIISALVLHIVGASDDAIAADYALTDHVDHPLFKEFTYKFVTVSGLTEDFGYAKPRYILDALAFLRKEYGGVSKYLNGIGFSNLWRERLRKKLLHSTAREGRRRDS